MPGKRALPLIALFYLVLVTALILRVPPGSAPDEAAHVDYVKYIAANRALPKFTGAPPPKYGYEFHQPPLYYALCAPGALIFQGNGLFLWCRAISALCGLGTLILIWRSARRVFIEHEEYAVLATGVAAVWPLHLGVSAAAGNDALAGLFCAVLFYLIARAAGDGWQPRHAILAGVCAGLGLWTKTTTLPVSIAVLGAAWNLERRGWVTCGQFSAPVTMIFTGVLVAAPLFMRNQMLYGDPLGWQAFAQAATAGTPGYEQMSQFGISFERYARGIMLILFSTMWGFFGGPDSAVNAIRPLAPSPRPFPAQLLLLAAICYAATALFIVGLTRLRAGGMLAESGCRLLVRWWLLGVLLVGLGWAQFAYAHFSGGQARYLHPALLPICVLGAAAWNTILPARMHAVAATIFWLALLSLSLLNIFVWRTLV